MMKSSAKGAAEIEAQVTTPGAHVEVVRYQFQEPPDSVLAPGDNFRLELCLTSRHRTARACFRNLWAPHRFERIGDLFVAPPSLEIVARSDEAAPQTSIVCELPALSVLELFEAVPQLTDAHMEGSLDIRDGVLRALLLRMADETRNPGFGSSIMVDLMARQLAVQLVRLDADVARREICGGLAPWQLRLIDERLREVRDAPTLPDLAALCRISVRQLTRAFRASRGVSIGAYVAKSQMEHAKRLLATDQRVHSIALALGFASSSNFCFAFRRATGHTPNEFRRKLLHQ